MKPPPNAQHIGASVQRIPLQDGHWTALLFLEPDVLPVVTSFPAPLPPFIEIGLSAQASALSAVNGAPLMKRAESVRLQQVYASSALRLTMYAAPAVVDRIRKAAEERMARRLGQDAEEPAPPAP